MKFVRYELGGRVHVGVLTADEKRVISMESLMPELNCDTMQRLIAAITPAQIAQLIRVTADPTLRTDAPIDAVHLLAPIDRPSHDVLCVGVNYRDHREETRQSVAAFEEPAKPVYFSKRAAYILGPQAEIDARFDLDECLDYEAELAVIIGRRGRDIPEAQAEDYIFGYSVFNDLSSRALQRQHVQWFKGKSLDGYTAMGPVILHKSALPLPLHVDLVSRVNGEVRQHSNTSLMLADVAKLVSDLSMGMTLEPGDIIATGTPAGVGMGFTPPRFLKSGDRVECEIPPIGCLANTVR